MKSCSETLETIRGKLKETETDLKNAMAKITDMEKQSDDLQEILEVKEGEFVQSLDELENDLSEKSRQVEEYKASVKKLEKSIEGLKTDLELKSGQSSKAEANIKLLEETIEKLKKEMSVVQNELTKQTRQRDEGKANIKKLEKSVDKCIFHQGGRKDLEIGKPIFQCIVL